MARMIRKQVYIEPRQEALLKRLAQEMNVTEAELIRQAIDQRLASGRARFRDPWAWDEARTFIQKWVALGPVPGGRNWTREELYEERE